MVGHGAGLDLADSGVSDPGTAPQYSNGERGAFLSWEKLWQPKIMWVQC